MRLRLLIACTLPALLLPLACASSSPDEAEPARGASSPSMATHDDGASEYQVGANTGIEIRPSNDDRGASPVRDRATNSSRNLESADDGSGVDRQEMRAIREAARQAALMENGSAGRPRATVDGPRSGGALPGLPARPIEGEPTAKPDAEGSTRRGSVRYSRNGWKNAAEDQLSTFAVDVDTANYATFRRYAKSGEWIPDRQVRLEEWVNYFDTADPRPATPDRPLQVGMQAAPCPWDDTSQLLRVALTSYVTPEAERPPLNLVLLVDRSGSMEGEEKLDLVKWGIRRLLDTMRPQDRVSIVSYSIEARLEIGPTGPGDRSRLEEVLNRLTAVGSTNGAEGLQLAYQTAESAMQPGSLNRVLLCSDGDFNVGLRGDDLVERVAAERDRGIYLSALLFGYTGNDAFLEAVTNQGNGTYHYIDSRREAERVLKTNVGSTIGIVAQDVKLQVDFDAGTVAEYRLLGYDNRMIADREFRNDTVDAGEIGPGHRVIAYYQVKLRDGVSLAEARVRDAESSTVVITRVRWKRPNSTSADAAQEMAMPIYLADVHESTDAASADFRFGAAVTWLALRLRGDDEQQQANLMASLPRILALARGATADRDDRHEFIRLVDELRLQHHTPTTGG